VRAFPADAPNVDRTFRTFERHILELLEQTARQRPAPWDEALAELATRLDRTGAEWFVCGSAALAVRGIDVEPRDVDFVTSDHARTAEAMADALIEPPLHDTDGRWVASWFGRAFLGARVEWVADVHAGHDTSGPNEIGSAAAAGLERVRWNGRTLLLSPLNLQLAANEQRGLHERVRAIRRFQDPGPWRPQRPRGSSLNASDDGS
jgi:hypothetical protein